MTDVDRGEQLELLTPVVSARSAARDGAAAAKRKAAAPLAAVDPVASVWVDTGLAHLDRPFDYAVPASMTADAVPGARVKVRFAGQDLDGFVVSRSAVAAHDGRLTPIRKVVSPEPVLTPHLLAVAQALAADKAGTVGDVLRLAIPPRHAAAEKALPVEPPASPGGGSEVSAHLSGSSPWLPYAAARAFLGHLASGGAPGASWLALPGVVDPLSDWPAALADAAVTAAAAGRGVVVVLPDHRDVTRVEAALKALPGCPAYVRLTADQGPQARWTAWLKALRGHVRIVVGTRAAAFAPVRDLGLVAWWDDGDDLLEEPRAPYPHVRDVLTTRAREAGAAVLSAGFSRTVAVEALVESGALARLEAPREAVRRAAPLVRVAGTEADLARDPAAASAHLPSVAWEAARAALAVGPVLVQVPRRGYLPSMSCLTCRRPARCAVCAGPVGLTSGSSVPQCRWCARPVVEFTCPHCGGHGLRAAVTGARRTAEELGRAFRGVPVHTSGSGQVLASVAAAPSLVIATPGAEPVADGGYAACLLLDAWASLDRPTLDAGEEALRRWLAAAALVRPRGGSPRSPEGRVVLVGAPTHTPVPAVEALVRWDPGWFAGRELADRSALGLPPRRRAAVVQGERSVVAGFLEGLDLPGEVVVLGPTPVGEPAGQAAGRPTPPQARATLLAPRAASPDPGSPAGAPSAGPHAGAAGGDALAAALRRGRAARSARKEGGGLTVRLDPRDLG